MSPLLLAATVFSAPVPVNQGTWFEGFGVSSEERAPAVIALSVTVNRHGYVESCRARTVVGNPIWAPFTCSLVKQRAYFRPAKLDGRSVDGVFRTSAVWLESGPLPENPPIWNFEVAAGNAAGGLKLPVLQKIQFAVDASGRVEMCGPKDKWERPEMVGLACAKLPEALTIRPAVDRSGKAVRSVQDAAVRFVPSVP